MKRPAPAVIATHARYPVLLDPPNALLSLTTTTQDKNYGCPWNNALLADFKNMAVSFDDARAECAQRCLDDAKRATDPEEACNFAQMVPNVLDDGSKSP